jgi:hypothetical protein
MRKLSAASRAIDIAASAVVETGASPGKTLFTINYIGEDFLAFRPRTDRRVNL